MKKLIHQFINCITIAIMAFFTIPKLLRKDQYATAVERFDYAISLNAHFFRICTEIPKLKVTVTALVFTFNQHQTLGKITYAFLFITMVTVVSLAFFVLPEPKLTLVIITIVLTLLSMYQLKFIPPFTKKQHS